MSEDQTIKGLKAYKEGYRDGYNDAVKFYVTNPILNMRPQDNVRNGCLVCGKSGVSHEVCYNSRCPSLVTCHQAQMVQQVEIQNE